MSLVDEKTLTILANPASASSGAVGLNWLSQIKEAIDSARELLPMLAQLRSGQATAGQFAGAAAKVAPASGQQILSIVRALGLDNVPIGKIIEQISPYSLNQIMSEGVKLLKGAAGGQNQPQG